MTDPVRDFLSKIGSKGGKKSASRLTAEERKARSKRAAEIRWEAYRRWKKESQITP